MQDHRAKPGFKWPLILGGAGFMAGFLGPMIFVPEANQGPLVGILISGPAGAILGLALQALCTVARVPASVQWRILIGTASAGALVVLLAVQPEPALRGYVLDLDVGSCVRLRETEAEVIDYWSKRIAEVTWAAARPGWQTSMRETLRGAPGAVLKTTVRQQISIWERRKPWNRGDFFASEDTSSPGERTFYEPNAACSDFVPGMSLRAFQAYDLAGRIEAPTEWPPGGIEQIIAAARIGAVPQKFLDLTPTD